MNRVLVGVWLLALMTVGSFARGMPPGGALATGDRTALLPCSTAGSVEALIFPQTNSQSRAKPLPSASRPLASVVMPHDGVIPPSPHRPDAPLQPPDGER